MQVAIVTKGLSRRFGRTDAVRDLELEVPAGSIYGLLGPNGAGKTTTIRMLTGQLKPSSGDISIFGFAMPAERVRITHMLGGPVETVSLHDHLTGRQNLEVARLLLRLPRAAVDRVLERADLAHAQNIRVGAYSLGMRHRLALGRAILGAPRLLILDEPGNGLHPNGLRDLGEMLRRLAEEDGITVLVSSHQLADVQHIAKQVGILAGGTLLTQGRMHDILANVRTRIEIGCDRLSEAAALIALMKHAVSIEGERLLVDLENTSEAMPELVARIAGAGIRLHEVRSRAPSIEDIYVHLTRPAAARGAVRRARLD